MNKLFAYIILLQFSRFPILIFPNMKKMNKTQFWNIRHDKKLGNEFSCVVLLLSNAFFGTKN